MDIITNNYLEYYNSIVSQIKKIDVYLKTSDAPLKTNEIADALKISEIEVCQIIETNDIQNLNICTFHTIMSLGSSSICKIYARLLEKGIPTLYSSEDIAYIYDIELEEVKKALLKLGKAQINESLLPFIFKTIDFHTKPVRK